MNGSNASKLLAWLVMAALPLLNSCSPQVRILRVSSPASDYEVKELHVTGRPIVAKHDFYPTLRIEGFNKPNGDPYFIDSPVADDELLTKLDPQKNLPLSFVHHRPDAGQTTTFITPFYLRWRRMAPASSRLPSATCITRKWSSCRRRTNPGASALPRSGVTSNAFTTTAAPFRVAAQED